MTERLTADEIVRKIYEARQENSTAWQLIIVDNPVINEWMLRIQKPGEEPEEFLGPDPMAGSLEDCVDYLQELDNVTRPGTIFRAPRYLIEEQLLAKKAKDELPEE